MRGLRGNSDARLAAGTHVMSTDAHDWHPGPGTSAPLLAHAARSRRAPGIRVPAAWHGIRLMANLDVATGQVVTPSLGLTRTRSRLCRSHHADPPDRSTGRLHLHHRSARAFINPRPWFPWW